MIELTQSERCWFIGIPDEEKLLLAAISREVDATFHYVPGMSVGPAYKEGERVGSYLTASCYDEAGKFYRPKFVVGTSVNVQCIACGNDMLVPTQPAPTEDEPYPEPPMCDTCESSYAAHIEAMEAEEDRVRQHGGLEKCPSCGHYSVRSSNVCTLGYPAHPGAEFSVYRVCERTSCEWAEL